MNVAEYVVEKLKVCGIEHVFGYQGGNITYMIDAIAQSENIEYVQTYHEQGAAFAANAYAQVSGKFGVALSSSGPGAINLMNGIANAYYDSIPCLFITGNINTNAMRASDKIRQNGFQEADIVGMVKGITKYATTIYKSEDIAVVLNDALKIMKEGRPGPVLIDIPHNIQRMEVKENISSVCVQKLNEEVDKETLNKVCESLEKSCKPVLLLGNGSRSNKSKKIIREFLEKMSIPVVVSLCGKDAIDNNHRCYRGMIGSYGLPYSNRVLQEADFVLVLGSRMDERQRSVSIDEFLNKAEVFHVEIDESEIGHVKRDEIGINTSVENFLDAFIKCIDKKDKYQRWLEETAEWMTEQIPENVWIFGSNFKEKLEHIVGENIENSVVCVDVGNHQMASAQILDVGANSYYLNSAGLGSMGYAIPAAIGAYYAAKDKRIICVTGDGGFMMNLQELQLIKREKLPIEIIVINNQCLGMIKNYQKLVFGGRFLGSEWGYEAANFKKVAEAFEIKYFNYKNINNNYIKKSNQACMIEIEV